MKKVSVEERKEAYPERAADNRAELVRLGRRVQKGNFWGTQKMGRNKA